MVIRWRSGIVTAVRREWPGALELDVLADEAGMRALAYPGLVGQPAVGDRVLLNTTALHQGLGTGGYALVAAVPDRLPPDPAAFGGHLVKARYTPLQATVAGADEQGSPHHGVLRDADDVGGMPVVVADLHSAVPAIAAGYLASRPGARVGYVMQDGGALPAWFSRSAAALTEAGWLAGTVTVGQAFGGDVETVSLHTGLLAVRHVLDAELAIVAPGPGNLGTGTRWGFSGVAAGEAVNAAAVLHGRPVGSLRISGADRRDRHRGISHHSLTAYGRVALAPADVVVPELGGDLGAEVRAAAAGLASRHHLVFVPLAGLDEALRASPVDLQTMGRGLAEEQPYFLAAAAAGRHAATLTAERPRYDVERSCVRIVLRDRDGRILLLRAELASRAAGHWWELPGGGIEAGEGYADAAVRELAEETGLVLSPAQVGPPRWRRSSTWTARGLRRLQHEVVVRVDLDAVAPPVTGSGRTAEEREEYTGSRWWLPAELLSSSERFYPGRLPELLPAFLAGAELTEPFERWN